jgi:uncharacterized protein YoxC
MVMHSPAMRDYRGSNPWGCSMSDIEKEIKLLQGDLASSLKEMDEQFKLIEANTTILLQKLDKLKQVFFDGFEKIDCEIDIIKDNIASIKSNLNLL